MTIDSISNMATMIRNAITIKNLLVTLPYTKNLEIIGKILAWEGFIHCVVPVKEEDSSKQKVIIFALKYVGSQKRPMIHAIKRVSKPSLRWYVQNPIPQSLGGLGTFIVSTNRGIITDDEAWDKKVGGEILLEIW